MSSELSIGFDEIREDMRTYKPRAVLLQLPSGMKRKAEEIARRIEKEYGCQVIISGDSCFGACDVTGSAMDLVDMIVQVGHSPMPSLRFPKPVIFMPVGISLDLHKLIKSAGSLLTSPVGLLVTSQHLGQLEESKRLLEEAGFEVEVGEGSNRLAAPGMVLGCDYSAAHDISDSVSSFLIIGGGRFHAIGLKLSTGKPVVIVDPEQETARVEEVDVDAYKRKRFAAITRLSKAQSIGIIVSLKVGQERLPLAKRLLKELKGAGRDGNIVLMDNITSEALQDIGFDAYVSTACPRIALDDSERYSRLICTPMELMISLKKSDWDDYQIDEWGYRLPGKGGA